MAKKKLTISGVPFNGTVIIDGQKHIYNGQSRIKIGGGHVTKYIFTNYNTGKVKFYGVQHQFDITQENEVITINK